MVRIWTYLCMCLILANKADAPVLPNQQSVKNCPQKCLCTLEGPAVMVQCRDRNLTSVPNTTFDKRVSRLDVSFNELYTLEDNTFFQYKFVNYIYLQHCMLENISEKTFQGLENLIFVDLSYNRLTSIPPNLFNGNHRLQTLKLRNNDLSTLLMNRTLLNGPPSLSSLDLRSCELSNLSSVTFSSLPNLTIIDISKNKLVILNFDTLSAHPQLQDVNLENNPFECGLEFEALWNAMQSNLSLAQYRTLTCQHKDGKLDIRPPKNQSPLYRPTTTPSVTPSNEPDTSASTTLQPSATLSHNPDTSASTTLQPSATLSHNPDTSASTTLQPSATLSHNQDTNTSTTRKSSMTPSNKSDASRNTTDNPTTPSEEGNYTILWKIIYIYAAFIFSLIVGFVVFVIYERVIRHREGIELNANRDAIPLVQNP